MEVQGSYGQDCSYTPIITWPTLHKGLKSGFTIVYNYSHGQVRTSLDLQVEPYTICHRLCTTPYVYIYIYHIKHIPYEDPL